MPRLVDHDERRRTIIETTWRIIAERGIENAGMREIARECGYAGPGVLTHYFPNKDALLLAAYRLICDDTDERINTSVSGRRGLTALRSLCAEIIPANPVTTVEARVAVAFWQRAQTEPNLRAVGREAQSRWRERILAHLAEAEVDGESTKTAEAALDPDGVAEELLTLMMGLHITAMLDPERLGGSRQQHLVERLIRRSVDSPAT